MMADRAGNIAVRSAGHVPMLAEGGSRAGVLDGRSSAAQWHGRLPHQWLPYAKNPARGYLTSSNQQPTGPDYPHYLGHNWPPSYRALRIETLLSGKAAHGLEDMMAYQRDVRVVQRDLIAPHLEAAGALTGGAAALRDLLTAWDGVATTDRIEPLALYTLMELIYDMAWDEAVFEGMPRPRGITLITLLGEGSPWLDVVATPAIVEDAPALVRRALEACVDTMAARYGSDPAGWRWGTHHRLTLRHLTRVPQLSALWSDTYEYPGFDQTLSPGTGLAVSKSASWRVIVDFATDPPRGYGVYPGGQSGNPFSTLYDLHMETYVNFEYYELHKPTGPGQLEAASVLTIRP